MNTWIGKAGDLAFTTAGNWSTGIAPAAGNDLVIDYGSQNIAGALLASTNLASLTIGSNHTGSLGSSTLYLVVSADRASISRASGSGAVLLDTGTTDEIDKLTIDSYSTATIGLRGNFGQVTIRHGLVVLEHGSVDDVFMTYDEYGSSPALTITRDASVTNLHRQADCSVSLVDDATVVSDYGDAGTFTPQDRATVTNYFLRGGTVYDRTQTTTALVRCLGGAYDARESPGKTITLMEKHAEADVLIHNPADTVTVGEEYHTLLGVGGGASPIG